MKDTYTLLSNANIVKTQAIAILEPLISDKTNWATDRYTYIYHVIHDQLAQCSTEEIEPLITNWTQMVFGVFATDEKHKLFCQRVYPEINSIIKARTVRSTLILLFQHLASQRLLRFHDKYFPNFQLSSSIVKSPLFRTLPRPVKFFALIQSKKRYEEFKHYLTCEEIKAINKSSLSDLTDRGWNHNVTQVRKCLFHNGFTCFEELTSDVLINYKARMADIGHAITFNAILPTISHLSRHNLSSVVGSPSYNSNTSEKNDDYRYITKGSAFELCGIKDAVIKRKVESSDYLTIHDWSVLKDDLKYFAPENLKSENNHWISTQLDYIETGGFEQSSKKNMNAAFSVLNLYIRSYLTHFFSKNDELPYPYPKKLKDFHGFIYVTPSRVLFENIFQQPISKLPLSLLDFIDETLQTDTLKGNRNKIRDTRARLKNYFDWVRDRYGSLDDFNLQTNPITKEDSLLNKGDSYKRSNKVIFQLEYWILLKEFLYLVSEKLIEDAENAASSFKHGHIKINKEIEFGEHCLKVRTVNVNYFKKIKLLLSDDSIVTTHAYQPYCALLVVACTGIRLSNAMWLDARTFDQDCSTLTDTDVALLFVNTDKAKTQPFQSELPSEVMELLKRANKLRHKIRGINQKPFPYQENKNSKWGEILPLLQYASKNRFATIQEHLADVLIEFENCLLDSDISFNSELFYAPVHIAPKDFLVLTNRGFTFQDKAFQLVNDEEGDLDFTPVTRKTGVTPHSFRKTYDTYMALIIGTKATGEISTGQTPAAVGYYCTPTPQQEIQVKTVGKAIGVPHQANETYASILKSTADEDKVVEALLSEGLKGIGGFTLTTSKYESDNIDKILERCTPEQIAVNRTHICLFNNECPDHILDRLAHKKTCALCPVAISTKHDGPAISAQIKLHCDRILEINACLTNNNLKRTEIHQLQNERVEETRLAAAWLSRHKYIVGQINNGSMIVLDDGFSDVLRMRHKIPQNETEAIIARLHEVEGIPTLQSNKLKKIADRMSRKLLKILKNKDFELPETNEIDVVISLINKITDLYQLDSKQLVDLLDSHKPEQLQSYSVLLDALEES